MNNTSRLNYEMVPDTGTNEILLRIRVRWLLTRLLRYPDLTVFSDI